MNPQDRYYTDQHFEDRFAGSPFARSGTGDATGTPPPPPEAAQDWLALIDALLQAAGEGAGPDPDTPEEPPPFAEIGAMFDVLVKDVMILCGVAEPHPVIPPGVLRSIELVLDDVTVRLAHNQIIDAGTLVLAVEFGPLPEARREEVMMMLLAANAQAAVSYGGTFGIVPETTTVVFCLNQSLPMLTADALHVQIGLLMQQAQAWRITHFLDAPPPPSAAQGIRI